MTGRPAQRFERREAWGNLAEAPDIQRKVEVFGETIPDGVRTILDVGCGDGAITNALAERWDVTGTDSSAAALEHLRTAAVQASAVALPFEDSSFDLVMSSQMLEHLDDADYRRAIAEMSRVTRDHLLISVPYREDLGLRQIRCPRCGLRAHVWGHQRAFTIDSLVRDLAGFEAVDVRIFGDLQEPPWPRPVLWAFHALRFQYRPDGQLPLCEGCGNDDYSAARGFPPGAGPLKAAIDRVRRRPPLPFWISVLARRS
jgi:SAM-dependent methyltransferase